MLNYNVNGLESKLHDQEFIDLIQKHDLVCLTETFMNCDIEGELFNDFNIYSAKAKKLSKQGRCSGGVVVLVRKYLDYLLL